MRQTRRNALVLATAQAIVGGGTPAAFAVASLAGSWLLADDKTLATLPVTGFNVGVAVMALPAAALMRAIGRKNGFMGGALVTAAGGLLGAMALFQQQFWLLVLAMAVVGAGGSFVQQYRFAAIDGAPAAFRPQAISWVLAGGVFASVIGPQIVRLTQNAFLPIQFAGAYLGIAVLGLIGAAILSTLHIAEAPAAPVSHDTAPPRSLFRIVSQPRFLVALICGVGSYSMMNFVMTGAPLAIIDCGYSEDISTLGIQWHVMSMYAPSFFTGALIARFGKVPMIALGLVMVAASAGVALQGTEIWNFWLGLVLLGTGWNFAFIGSTAMVTDCYGIAEKARAQGFHDFILFGAVALASFFSGQVLASSGWQTMNIIVFPVVALCLIALSIFAWTNRRGLAED
nr:MFS transporter [Consotaella salsifontis]